MIIKGFVAAKDIVFTMQKIVGTAGHKPEVSKTCTCDIGMPRYENFTASVLAFQVFLERFVDKTYCRCPLIKDDQSKALFWQGPFRGDIFPVKYIPSTIVEFNSKGTL